MSKNLNESFGDKILYQLIMYPSSLFRKLVIKTGHAISDFLAT